MPLPSLFRPRYSLRALLVVMTLFALFFWYHINWIKQRRAAIASGYVTTFEGPGETPPPAPGLLWLFGEKGYNGILIEAHTDDELEPGMSLFPEAAVANALFSDASLSPFDK